MSFVVSTHNKEMTNNVVGNYLCSTAVNKRTTPINSCFVFLCLPPIQLKGFKGNCRTIKQYFEPFTKRTSRFTL